MTDLSVRVSMGADEFAFYLIVALVVGLALGAAVARMRR